MGNMSLPLLNWFNWVIQFHKYFYNLIFIHFCIHLITIRVVYHLANFELMKLTFELIFWVIKLTKEYF